MERWKGLIYHGEDYSTFLEVSNLGNIRRRGREKHLKPFMKENGYLMICTTLGSRKNKKHFSIHRAVAESFIPNDNPLLKVEVNHIDGVKTHNEATNLEWCDKSYNMKHAIQNGLASIPCKRYTALTASEKETVRMICVPGDKNYGITALARKFGVSRTAISNSLRIMG